MNHVKEWKKKYFYDALVIIKNNKKKCINKRTEERKSAFSFCKTIFISP